jgi:lambda family phage portal protein
MVRPRALMPNVSADFSRMKADYEMSKSSPYRRQRSGYALTGSSADYHLGSEPKRLRMIEEARDFDRNDCIVGQTIDRAVANLVQQGFTLDPNTGDRGADQALFDRWMAWSTDADLCDVAGEMTFADFERLIPRQMLIDGDVIALPTADGPLQIIEAHRCRTPSNTGRNVVHGVLLDGLRKRQEYWITRDDLAPNQPLTRVADTIPYTVRDADGNRQLFHVYHPKRSSQTRGVTAFAPIVNLLGMFEDINFAKLVQQQIVSFFAIFETYDTAGGDLEPLGERETETLNDGATRTLEGIAPGMLIRRKRGETLEGFSPNVPNPEFFDHMKLILTLVGVNLGLPLAVVLLDPSQTNFSGWRGAIDQARLGWRQNQRALADRWHRPVYRWKVRQWLDDDPALRAIAERGGIDLFKHVWHPPKWPYIEPIKDATAGVIRLKNGLTSPRRLHAEQGDEWEAIAAETVDDNDFAIRRAIEAATEINAEFNGRPGFQPVHWRELLSLPAPDGVTLSIGTGTNDQPRENRDDDA